MKVFIDIIIREAKEIATTISNITTNIASGFKKAFKNISEGIIEFFKAPLVQISALFTGFELFKKISEFGQFQKQLAGLEGSIEKARQKFDELSQSALKYSQSIETAISVYTAFRGVFSEDIATAFTNQLLKISDSLGLNEAQTQSLTRAFIRLFTDSTIGAREFNLVLSQTPQVAGLLAQSLGTSVAELRQKIEEGKISAKELAKAFMEIKPPEPPKTLSEQLSVISQKIALIIYKLGEKLGLWNAIIKALEFVEKVLNGINNIQGKFKSDLASIFSLSKSVFSNLEPIFEKWKIAISKIFELLWNVLVIISKIALIVIDKLKPAFEIILNIITAFVNALLFIIRKVQEFVNFISGQKKVEVKAEVKTEIKEPEKTFDISKLQSIPETKTFEAKVGKLERKEEKDLSFIEKLQLAQKLAEIENATNEELLKRIGLREEEIKALKEKQAIIDYEKIRQELINKEIYSQLENVRNRQAVEIEIFNYSQALKTTKYEEKRTLEEIYQLAVKYNEIIQDTTIPEEVRLEKLQQLRNQIEALSSDEQAKFIEFVNFINSQKTQINVEVNIAENILQNIQSSLTSQAFIIGQQLGQALFDGANRSIRQIGNLIFNTIVQSVASAVSVANPILSSLVLLGGGILSAIFGGGRAGVEFQANVQNNINITINIGEAIINDKEYWERLAGRIIFPAINRNIGGGSGGAEG